jgi:hypothetical protein
MLGFILILLLFQGLPNPSSVSHKYFMPSCNQYEYQAARWGAADFHAYYVEENLTMPTR